MQHEDRPLGILPGASGFLLGNGLGQEEVEVSEGWSTGAAVTLALASFGVGIFLGWFLTEASLWHETYPGSGWYEKRC